MNCFDNFLRNTIFFIVNVYFFMVHPFVKLYIKIKFRIKKYKMKRKIKHYKKLLKQYYKKFICFITGRAIREYESLDTDSEESSNEYTINCINKHDLSIDDNTYEHNTNNENTNDTSDSEESTDVNKHDTYIDNDNINDEYIEDTTNSEETTNEHIKYSKIVETLNNDEYSSDDAYNYDAKAHDDINIMYKCIKDTDLHNRYNDVAKIIIDDLCNKIINDITSYDNITNEETTNEHSINDDITNDEIMNVNKHDTTIMNDTVNIVIDNENNIVTIS